MSIDRVNAVILAGGGSIHDRSTPDEGPNKALVGIGSCQMVDYVVNALRRSPGVAGIVLVGPESLQESLREPQGILFAAAGRSPLGSFAAGVAVLDGLPDRGGTEWVLACTGDIPFLTPEAVADFLDRCRRREADVYYPIIPREAAEEKFPGVRRTYVRLQEGSFTGGNLFLANRRIIDDCLPRAEEFIRLRKKPVALAGLVGFGILLKYLCGRLRLQEAERRVCSLFGIRGAAVITPYAEIGVDVDKPSDLELARKLLVQGL
ncbi:MAG TPA: NTP transferase domain-containing protein [Syntrophomonadaceae bacterium]|nr:NTP transferase domain-containing protein [Syntrophomonadaceae bacterium]